MRAGINYTFRGLRVANEYTQEELAKEIDVSAATVGNWEAGRSRPKPRDMMELSRTLKTPVEDIVRMFI